LKKTRIEDVAIVRNEHGTLLDIRLAIGSRAYSFSVDDAKRMGEMLIEAALTKDLDLPPLKLKRSRKA
jgi:hypothetical protein